MGPCAYLGCFFFNLKRGSLYFIFILLPLFMQISPDVDCSNNHSQRRERGGKKRLNLVKPENSSPVETCEIIPRNCNKLEIHVKNQRREKITERSP